MRDSKFYAKKRTRSGVYITIAEGETRAELIDKIKSDSETYKKRESEENGKKIY